MRVCCPFHVLYIIMVMKKGSLPLIESQDVCRGPRWEYHKLQRLRLPSHSVGVLRGDGGVYREEKLAVSISEAPVILYGIDQVIELRPSRVYSAWVPN